VSARRLLSIVVPAYNEERSIGALLARIHAVDTGGAGFDKEIVVVDDGSRDRTAEVAASFDWVRVVRMEKNGGKGRAVQRGIAEARGDYVLVQDADLEYFPEDYPLLLAPVRDRDDLVVYGSRTLGQFHARPRALFPGRHPEQALGPYAAGLVLSGWTFALYGRLLTDTLTAYKLYPRHALARLDVKTHGFETDHELTAKLARAGYEIREVPIRYSPRSVAEGKKIRARDGLVALWTLVRFRVGRR
jgi:dolichol-phosphate mannosyltransferase